MSLSDQEIIKKAKATIQTGEEWRVNNISPIDRIRIQRLVNALQNAILDGTININNDNDETNNAINELCRQINNEIINSSSPILPPRPISRPPPFMEPRPSLPRINRIVHSPQLFDSTFDSPPSSPPVLRRTGGRRSRKGRKTRRKTRIARRKTHLARRRRTSIRIK